VNNGFRVKVTFLLFLDCYRHKFHWKYIKKHVKAGFYESMLVLMYIWNPPHALNAFWRFNRWNSEATIIICKSTRSVSLGGCVFCLFSLGFTFSIAQLTVSGTLGYWAPCHLQKPDLTEHNLPVTKPDTADLSPATACLREVIGIMQGESLVKWQRNEVEHGFSVS